MLKIGITGGIGSGKTTICKVFELIGIPVFYADTVAKEIMTTDPLLKEQIQETFGRDSYFQDGSVNRKYIAKIVFNDQAELEKLNALVHPAVFRAFDNWVIAQDPAAPYILKEAALLYESESYKMCDKSVLVTAPIETKISRVMHRDSVSKEEVEARMAKQWTDEQKLPMADYSLVNDESTSIIQQVLHLHQQFLQL